ncbi:hypothetical protein BH10CYA1_BH10CYA1_20770 [soil metagenome]
MVRQTFGSAQPNRQDFTKHAYYAGINTALDMGVSL